MECKGCGEKLDGIVEIAMHICPTPHTTKLMDAPMRDRGEIILPLGRAGYEAMEECLKEMYEQSNNM